jgi:hypothetical protein
VIRRGRKRDKRKNALQAPLLHLLSSGNAIATNRLNTLRVEVGLLLRRILVLESDVALLGEEDAWKVDL